ncbi:hypothetical protein MBCUT_03920 [Methanobrevibacter cuticularis]|uniref:GTP-dependent dephospho-CoA kinase n=1 Tax=Methanobrevibacter cuticularis TaxID=47311 RepID=A0A166EZ39_9EURY|nr:DUF359 domain-containing protein [Methanobrevibacter cuticularis]KZX17160.1 hypothetical protein MBCUT_03920 [Methanobrevibacter cuticularis]
MLHLEKNLRDELKRPFGRLYSSFDDAIDDIRSSKFLISVGDSTTNNLINVGIYPNISIIDNLIQRKIHNHEIIYTENILRAKNPPGTITDDLWETIELAINKSIHNDNGDDGENQNHLIVVDGEEDLAVLPVIILAPEETIVLYGQPNEGLVFVNVSDVKTRANELIKKFKKI